MSLPKYAEYTAVDIPWVDEIPTGWSSIALGRVLAQPVTDGPHTTPIFVDSGIPFLSVDAIQDGRLSFDGCRFISEADHIEFSKKAAPRRDDILMGKAASVGKIARVQGAFEFSIWVAASAYSCRSRQVLAFIRGVRTKVTVPSSPG